MRSMKTAVVGGAIATGFAFASAGAVSAEPFSQEGLVNVFVDDTTVQIPIAVAANVCDVSVNVIATQAGFGDTTCDAMADAEANNEGGRDKDGPRTQRGLINLALDDTTIQVPLSVAANLCDIAVNILAEQVELGDDECNAVSDAGAEN